MTKLSTFEMMVLREMKRAPHWKKWTVSDIAELAYGRKGARPKNWRQSIATRMRILRIKTDGTATPVERVSPIGRGNVAEYRIGEPSKKRSFLFSETAR